MKILLVTQDQEMVEAARNGFHPSDEMSVFATWQECLENCAGAELMFVDLIATLEEPGKIAGYEKFAMAKMAHEVAGQVPLIVITPPADYELDFMAGWPDFVLGNIQRPVTDKIFRRASTWV